MGRKLGLRAPDRLTVAAFVVGAGVSAVMNAVLGGIGCYTMEFGQGSFLWISMALYLPSFPVALMMIAVSDWEASECTSQDRLWCDARRIVGAFLGMAGLGFALAVAEMLGAVLGLSACVGVLSAAAMGYATQMVMRASAYRKSGGSFEAALTFGYQASSLACFAAQRIADLDPMTPNMREAKWTYFGAIGALSAACVPAVIYFARFALAPLGNELEPILGSGAASPCEQAESSGARSDGDPESPDQYGWYRAVNEAWGCAVGLFLTIFGSIVIFPFYSFVPSEKGTMAAGARLATDLFYVKTFSDTLSRPATVVLPPCISTPKVLQVVSFARVLVFVPAFFLYTFGKDAIPLNDFSFCVAAGLFAASSGYLKTVSYQLAPIHGRSQSVVRRVSMVLNLSFQVAFCVALLVSVVLRYTVVAMLLSG